MSTYAIGDIQGCADELELLLQAVGFGANDQLWLVGDLVNRGPDSVRVMQIVMSLESQTKVVLGNHDLHLLAMYIGGHSPGPSDTVHDLLDHKLMPDIARFLCCQSLFHTDSKLGWSMSHAGLPMIWSLNKAQSLADEVSEVLCDVHPKLSRESFFRQMYGNKPALWRDQLTGLDRLKLITNYFTRMRLMRPDGTLDFSHKGHLRDAPQGWMPWYELAAGPEEIGNFVFGHWAALNGFTSRSHLHAIDSGCVYGKTLTALCLETGQRTRVKALRAYSD
ncbi:MAG: symmetrical bis(5'-nucleosyl)-tetraphosphatase [Pseudomonadota bacterium]